MGKQENAEARERVIVAADQLFTERGYQKVTLRDIAREMGIRHTSLYHHFPQGKEELYIEVTTLRMQRYRVGLEQAIGSVNNNNWQGRLRVAAHWLLTQPDLHIGRLLQSDMPLISEVAAGQLEIMILSSLLQPLEAIFRAALATDPVKRKRCTLLAGMFLSLIEGINNLPPQYVDGSKEDLADEMLDVLVNGLQS